MYRLLPAQREATVALSVLPLPGRSGPVISAPEVLRCGAGAYRTHILNRSTDKPAPDHTQETQSSGADAHDTHEIELQGAVIYPQVRNILAIIMRM